MRRIAIWIREGDGANSVMHERLLAAATLLLVVAWALIALAVRPTALVVAVGFVVAVTLAQIAAAVRAFSQI